MSVNITFLGGANTVTVTNVETITGGTGADSITVTTALTAASWTMYANRADGFFRSRGT